MAAEVNRYGLSRTIDEATKREIRKKCGFGCVICGLAITQYEHVDPEFKDAKEHDPTKICLLCGSCHDRITRRSWSKDKVKEAMTNPWSVRKNKCRDAFDIGSDEPAVWLGSHRSRGIPTLIRIDNVPLLAIEGPEYAGGPYRISGQFHDAQGQLLFRIEQNEWIGSCRNWDVDCTGPRVTIRSGPRNIVLKIRAIPPKGLVIEKINTHFNSIPVTGDANRFAVGNHGFAEAGDIVGHDGYDGALFSVSSSRPFVTQIGGGGTRGRMTIGPFPPLGPAWR